MVDFEKGTPSWDIGMILTRHRTVPLDDTACKRVQELRRTALERMGAHERLERALNTDCTCGVGDSDSERTSLIGGGINGLRARATARNGQQQETGTPQP